MILETSSTSRCCYIGLGSNLDKPIQHITTAIDELKTLAHCQYQGTSSLYRSAPVGPAGQDDYINAVACLTTTLTPEQLLNSLQAIENAHQRVRVERWSARTLDLDILLIDNLTIDTTRLTVPHPYIQDRNFVLIPLFELAGEISINDQLITDLLKTCPAGELQLISA
jgi:2-amino-4-hydroxy-6-hydroxymethyldihydropteridine diphosphokinase